MAKPALVPSSTSAQSAARGAAPAAAQPAQAAPAKRGKARWLIALVMLVLIAGASGGAWWYLRGSHEPQAKSTAVKPPVFHSMEPFTVNLLEENGDHYLQVAVVLQVEEDKVTEQVKTYLPIIRNRILLLLSGKRPSELATPEGKERLVAEILKATREAIPGTTPERGVTSAYLGAFVIQ